jgi:L-threonine synthase (EC 4.2.3.1)
MRYFSTRGQARPQRFSEVLLSGLAEDGGLMLPERLPPITLDDLTRWRGLPYRALAAEVISRFVTEDDLPRAELERMTAETYMAATFGSEAITPLTSLEALQPSLWLQGLSNGPTLAFKDMAMQLLGRLFEYELKRQGRRLNILGATSGDTGSAAEYAMRGRAGINVFMLSPAGRMSPFQRAQMYSLTDANIHNIAIEGVFDDCQDIVKAVSNDLDFKSRYAIGTVNSINWGRIVAQIVYYVYGYLQATVSNEEQVSFAVPFGQFRQHPGGSLRPRDGLADCPVDPGHEREQRAGRVLPNRCVPSA